MVKGFIRFSYIRFEYTVVERYDPICKINGLSRCCIRTIDLLENPELKSVLVEPAVHELAIGPPGP